MKVKISVKITDFTEMGHQFHGRRPISRKMSRPWNRGLGWSLVIIELFSVSVTVLSQFTCLMDFMDGQTNGQTVLW